LDAALSGKGQVDEAIGQFREALKLQPDYPIARNNLQVALDAETASAQ